MTLLIKILRLDCRSAALLTMAALGHQRHFERKCPLRFAHGVDGTEFAGTSFPSAALDVIGSSVSPR